MKSPDLVRMEVKLVKLKSRVEGLEDLVKAAASLERKAEKHDGLSVDDNALLSATYAMFYRRLEVIGNGL